ncbi:hypothetical protein HDU91_000927, partial [Kappamyces sp. JEL0680]
MENNTTPRDTIIEEDEFPKQKLVSNGSNAVTGASTSSLTKTLLESLPPIPNISPALLPTIVTSLEDEKGNSLHLSQSLPIHSVLLTSRHIHNSAQSPKDDEVFCGAVSGRARSLNEEGTQPQEALSPVLPSPEKAWETDSIISGTTSQREAAAGAFLHKSDLDVSSSLGGLSSFHYRNSSNSRAHSGGSRNGRRNRKSDTCSLSSRNSEDEDIGEDDLPGVADAAGGVNPSFLSSASLPLTPFKNQ